MPMDETSTTSSLRSENILRAALKGVSYGKPAEKTLDFIRSFAAGLRFVSELPEEAGTFSLN